jgi:hypothetical protein
MKVDFNIAIIGVNGEVEATVSKRLGPDEASAAYTLLNCGFGMVEVDVDAKTAKVWK